MMTGFAERKRAEQFKGVAKTATPFFPVPQIIDNPAIQELVSATGVVSVITAVAALSVPFAYSYGNA